MSATSEVMLLITSCDRVGESQEVLPEIDSIAIRFWSLVDRSGGNESCWPWTGGSGSDGYGLFNAGGRSIGAHRQACILAHGAPPSLGMQACHDPRRCSSRRCCNPAHLRWDSPAGNQHDVRITLTRRGERNPKAKLTEEQVRAVWAERGKGGYIEIAKRLGLPFRAVRRVLDGTNWSWLTGARGVAALLLLALSAIGCRDSVEIISGIDGVRTCDVGARLEVTPFGVLQALSKCVCAPSRADGGR